MSIVHGSPLDPPLDRGIAGRPRPGRVPEAGGARLPAAQPARSPGPAPLASASPGDPRQPAQPHRLAQPPRVPPPASPALSEGLNGHPQVSHAPAAGIDADEATARAAFERARAGQRSAYGIVARLYQDRLYNAVYRMTGDRDDAAEITQEAFTRGLEKLDEFRGESGPYTWLFRIAMNAAVSRIRRSSRRKTLSLDALDAAGGGYATSFHGAGSGRRGKFSDQVASAQPTPAEAAQSSESHRAVVAALDRLDAEYRALLVMRDLEGFDYKQMAEVLGLPLGTLKSRLFRARVALREMLQDHFSKLEQSGGPADRK